jgi:hypothetical protein
MSIIKNYFTKITETNFNELDFFKYQLSPENLKNKIFEETIKRISNDSIKYFDLLDWSLDNFSIAKDSNNWTISSYINKNKLSLPLLPTKNIFYYELLPLTTDNDYIFNFIFNSNVINPTYIYVFFEENGQYTDQFYLDSSSFNDAGNGRIFINGQVSIPNQTGKLGLVLYNSSKTMFKIYIDKIDNNYYFVPDLSINVYSYINNLNLLYNLFPIFYYSNSNNTYSYSYTIPISSSYEVLLASIHYKDSYIQKYYKTYLPPQKNPSQ